MIGRLSGEVAEVEADAALLDVAGVGYVVRMGARTLDRLGLAEYFAMEAYVVAPPQTP